MTAITTSDQAINFRDGLMIALVAYRPRLRTNFMAITVGTHLIERRDGHWLCFHRI